MPTTLGAALRVNELPEHLEWLHEHGGRDVEIQDPCYPGVLEGDWRKLVGEARAMLEGHGGRVGVHGAYDGLELASFDPVVQGFVRERHRQNLEFAGALGATHLVIHSPFAFFGSAAHRADTGLTQELERVHATLQPLVQTAADVGCAFVIETIQDLEPAPLLALVRSFDSPFVRLSVDVGHVQLMTARSGVEPKDWLLEGADVLAHLHLQDNNGVFDRHLACGDGIVDWAAVLRGLEGVSTNPRAMIEVSASDLRRAAAHLVGTGYAV
jgi:sugar phosphate isomerase/epimerase